jgi:putative Ca2+/H+ antiporter (TMEM165/GDT1 family)
MLATVTLATQEGLIGTWLGSTIGMVLADGLAIAVGKALGDRLQAKTVRIASSIAFFVFAILMFADALR